ncbi:EVE domain-containing protein [Myxococcota bacterium]|nr:EVE domain-containing protein [Myxococcota bacterium]
MTTDTPRRAWIVKSEPEVYPWAQLVADGRTAWSGVRNFQARNFLRAMGSGDRLLYYHSSGEKAVVAVAQVTREHYPDPTAPGEDWSAVDVVPLVALARPVPLKEIKGRPELAGIPLVRQSRLSVSPLSWPEYALICEMGGIVAP